MKGLAICSKGIEDITAMEIKELINSKAEIKDSCVIFDVKKQEELALLCYKAQSVDKILLLFDSFEFKNGLFDKIKEKIGKIKLDEWLDKKTFRVSSEIINNGISSAEVNESVGEIIFEKFRNKVDLENPGLVFFVFINSNNCYLGIDFAGIELQKRQYKVLGHAAALRSTIAYSLVRIADYKEDEILLDAFAGSGTILIEAALFTSRFPVNYYNKDRFAFLKLMKFDFNKEDRKIKEPAKPRILGYDSFLGCTTSAKKNAKIAGIEKFIDFSRIEVEWLDTKVKKGKIDKIASNPPALSKNKNPKDIEKLYNEFFYQAEFILNSKGKIVLVTYNNSLESLKRAAEKNKFKIKEKRKVMHGKEERIVLVFRKI